MKKLEFINSFTGCFNKIGFQLKKHSPEILVVAGVAGVIASTVMACKATTKSGKVLEEAKEAIDEIHTLTENKTLTEVYTPEDANKDITIVYAQMGVELVKLYAPAVALGVLSLSFILTSNNILRKRNVALAAAYATVNKGFKEYRDRIAERFGTEIDRELKYDIKATKIVEVVVDENGEEKTIEKTINVVEPLTEYSDYSRFFDSGCYAWEKDPEYNLMFLRAQQQYANDKLKANGRLFLNDVYDMLGIPRSKAGQVVGWVYDPKNPAGDNYIDFGIYNAHSEVTRDFVNGYEPVILLDFNVDGNIWNLM